MKRLLSLFLSIALLFALFACAAKTPAAESTSPSAGAPASPASSPSKTPEPSPEESKAPALPEGVAYTNVLLMGGMDVDFLSSASKPYALTYILMTLDPENRVLRFTSFPYNLAVDVDVDGKTETMQMQMLSMQYSQDEIVAILEKDFGIKIDYWAHMNMQAMIDIIDALGGVEIDIESLSINDVASELKMILGIIWDAVTKTGLQILTGIQSAGYFLDTLPQTSDWMKEEEMNFRDRHGNLIKAAVMTVKTLGLDRDDLIKIVKEVQANYITSIPEAQWPALADTALYCLENDPQFLFVPEVITASEANQNDMVYDRDKDVAAVHAFVGGK